MQALPSGTVTLVFTDIEGSTALLKRLGSGYGEVLAAHRRIVRETFQAANGIEIDTQGDAFFFAFPRARDAIAAAVEAQRAHAVHSWPEESVVRVRMGLHNGEPSVVEEGYLGLDVVRAARICTVARGGNVLLSESTRALLGSTLPDGVSVFPRGERHLKGIDEPERVFELAIEGVENEELTAEEDVPAPSSPPPSPAAPTPADRAHEISKSRDFGADLAASIQERVLGSLERSLGKHATPSTTSAAEDADVDGLAERTSGLEEQIRARVEAALRAKGISRDEG
ncbi:MAG: adenylate/guanylate cyclase domain-containing protein [Actinobacteria bacterium]|nr:adenylate/guanylate cyclase domain-containing protein [Actinomycetota bacterium]